MRRSPAAVAYWRLVSSMCMLLPETRFTSPVCHEPVPDILSFNEYILRDCHPRRGRSGATLPGCRGVSSG
jgi:hypothetical protein